MRKAHVLKFNASSPYPVNLVFFDTETTQVNLGNNQVEHIFKLGWACFYRRRNSTVGDTQIWHEITDVDKFWEWVLDHVHKKERLYLVAHNIDFDLAVLHGYEKILEHGYKLVKYWERGMCRFYKWKNGDRTVIGIDNTNIFPGKLEKLGASLGLPKLEVNFGDVSREALSVYCKRDVEIMVKAWKRWIEFCRGENLGAFGVTLAAQAFNAYRHRFMTSRIFIHNNEKALQLERECYKGGRCECFYIGSPGGSKFYYLDVNSMYPFVMLENLYPSKLLFYKEKPSVKFLKEMLGKYLICAHVCVEINAPAFPVRIKQKTFYPVGEFDCYLSTPELKFAVEKGRVKKVYAMCVYRAANIFTDYVNYFYSQRISAREKGDTTLQYFFKIMLNSLYGKFGQKSMRWEKIGECDPELEEVETVVDRETGKRYTIRKHNGIVEQSGEEKESYNSFPAVAAHVTAYARMYLFELMLRAGVENVFYSDTDSLMVSEEGYNRLLDKIDEKKLGMLKVEDVTSSLEIRGPKDYTFGNTVRLKGIRSTAVEISPGVFEQDKWLGFSTRLRQGKINTYIVEKTKKTLQRKYAKGRVTEGGRVIPWVLPQDWETLSSVL